MISVRHRGSFSNLEKKKKNAQKGARAVDLNAYGQEGVAALMSATPIDSGKTASSWYYEIHEEKESTVISFCNSNIQNGVPIAVILQYGHGTGTGGWVQGRDYINPAIQPIFDEIANRAWREVTKK